MNDLNSIVLRKTEYFPFIAIFKEIYLNKYHAEINAV